MDENDAQSQYHSSGGGIIGLIIFGLIIWWAYSTFFGKDYSKPWWDGTQSLLVCDVTTSNLSREYCYTLPVTSNGDYVTRVSFPNGGYLVANDSNCYEAASFYNFEQFCNVLDQQGRRWDIVPLDANI